MFGNKIAFELFIVIPTNALRYQLITKTENIHFSIFSYMAVYWDRFKEGGTKTTVFFLPVMFDLSCKHPCTSR